MILQKIKIYNFFHFYLFHFFRFTIICQLISDLQEHAIPQSKAADILFWPYFLIFGAIIKFLWDRKQKFFLMFDQQLINGKNCKIWHFLKNLFFSFLIITLVLYDIQKPTIPQIKAKDIWFVPNLISFLARINIFWDKK